MLYRNWFLLDRYVRGPADPDQLYALIKVIAEQGGSNECLNFDDDWTFRLDNYAG